MGVFGAAWKYKITAFFLCCLFLSFSNASAVDFQMRGAAWMAFEYGQNGNFSNHGHSGYNTDEDDFEARSRFNFELNAIASENLSAQAYFEVGKFIWGKAGNLHGGAALGADGNIVSIKRAFIDWKIPDTELAIRMGIQLVGTPFFALDAPTVLNNNVAGITANYKFNDNISATAMWLRPYNDNYINVQDASENSFMDNLDIGGLFLPLTFDRLKLTPWGLYGRMGPNTLRNQFGQFEYSYRTLTMPDVGYFLDGMFPINIQPGIIKKQPDSYADIWWAGVAGEFAFAEGWRAAWEFTYGGLNWPDAESLSRKGWLGALLLERKTAWGTPGIYGWYGSGDDDDLGNGSERLPYMGTHYGVSGFGDSFAGPSQFGIERERVIANTLSGTWGIGARWKDFSFIRYLRHSFHVSLWGGTNSSGILEKIHNRAGRWMSPNNTDGLPYMGRANLYLTDKDYALELGLNNSWRIYENLIFNLNASYVAPFLDKSDSVWGLAETGGGERAICDAWNIGAVFMYFF